MKMLRSFLLGLRKTQHIVNCKCRCFTASFTLHRKLHVPVMLEETVTSLNIGENHVILDMTFGAGGHSKKILESYPTAKVLALDRDDRAIKIAHELTTEYSGRLYPLIGQMSEVDKLMEGTGRTDGALDSILIDAGCSSMQFDEPYRGFSLSKDGPLDMRMDGERVPNRISAADVVNNLPWKDLKTILEKYGDERHGGSIAQSIVENRPIQTTKQLAECVASAFPYHVVMATTDAIGRRRHIATKTFMAIRIFVNDEMNELHAGVTAASRLLRAGGRLAVLTYHSLEDRVVKRALKNIAMSKPANMSLKQTARRGSATSSNRPPSRWADADVFLPGAAEVARNPRARSAKLRVATRSG